MGEEPRKEGAATKVSRRLTGRLKKGDRIVAVKEHEETPSHVPIPHPRRDFDEHLCPPRSGQVPRASGIPGAGGRLLFLRGDSEAVIGRDGEVTLVFTATDRTLEAYHVTPKGLLEFADVLEGEFGYEVRIVPSGAGGRR